MNVKLRERNYKNRDFELTGDVVELPVGLIYLMHLIVFLT